MVKIPHLLLLIWHGCRPLILKSCPILQNFTIQIRRCMLKFCQFDKISIHICVFRVDSYTLALERHSKSVNSLIQYLYRLMKNIC